MQKDRILSTHAQTELFTNTFSQLLILEEIIFLPYFFKKVLTLTQRHRVACLPEVRKMKTVHEISAVSGISVRTLHYYDSINLLKPTCLTEAGYRLYDDEALKRLQTVLMFRELGFALKDIKKILESPDFDLNTALKQHIELLEMQRSHIDGLIEQAEKMMKGENAGFSAFDKTEMEKYADEVRKRWGNTDAYKESENRLSGKTDEEIKNVSDGLMKRFSEFGKIKNLSPDSAEAHTAVKELQNYITANFYTCTNEILSGLGEMYVADERFRKNIDSYGGEGTALFVEKAIKAYCG